MRKLMLVNFEASTGDLDFKDYRLVVINHEDGDVEDDLTEKAARIFKKQFKSYFPESVLRSVIALPTWGEVSSPKKTEVVLDGQVCYGFEDHPIKDEDGEWSVYVIIDPDGFKKNIRTGFYDFFNKEWVMFTEEGYDIEIDQKHMRWIYNPLTHPNK